MLDDPPAGPIRGDSGDRKTLRTRSRRPVHRDLDQQVGDPLAQQSPARSGRGTTHDPTHPPECRAARGEGSPLGPVAYSLTTDQSVYQPGQPVEMTFRATNVSSQPVTVEDGPSIDGFTASRDGAVVWRSNAGINPLYIRLETLQPGQSLTLTATWDGIPNGGSASGLPGASS